MSLAVVFSRAQTGIEASQVTVEVHLANGLPSLSIVGLPETAVKESKDRVRSAIVTCNYEFPLGRITVNLAPADLPKEGGRFDLPIAVGILAASGQLPEGPLARHELLGELALGGEVRGVRGALPAALRARQAGRALILPTCNADEALLARQAEVLPARHLLEVCAHLSGRQPLTPHLSLPEGPTESEPDLAEVYGQAHAKRVLEIAAAGGHSLLFIGPPGTGKTMLASRLPGILPPMGEEEAIESAAIASLCDTGISPSRWQRRPFRAPHHTASAVALVGGGSHPKPGEISLAHNGVLFLDELPEFDRKVLEVLREPLESGSVTISRAARQARFPARFQLIAAMNPCPCGYLGHLNGRCRCSSEQVQRYRARLSGPLLDRIDMHIEVPPPPRALLLTPGGSGGERSEQVRARVVAARRRQMERSGKLNSVLTTKEIDEWCQPNRAGAALLEGAAERLGLSARAIHRVLRVARTIADIEGRTRVDEDSLAEAITYRRLDRAPST